METSISSAYCHGNSSVIKEGNDDRTSLFLFDIKSRWDRVSQAPHQPPGLKAGVPWEVQWWTQVTAWDAEEQINNFSWCWCMMHEVTWNVMKTTHWSHCLYKDHLYWGHQKWREDQGIRISTSQWSQLEGQGAACQQSLLYDQGIWLPADQVMHLRVWEPEHQKIS